MSQREPSFATRRLTPKQKVLRKHKTAWAYQTSFMPETWVVRDGMNGPILGRAYHLEESAWEDAARKL